MTTPTHTPTPCYVHECQNGEAVIVDSEGYTIAMVPRKSQAYPIVTACNAHEGLKSALSELTRLAHQMNALQHAGIENEHGAWAQLYQATNTAKAALALAEGKE